MDNSKDTVLGSSEDTIDLDDLFKDNVITINVDDTMSSSYLYNTSNYTYGNITTGAGYNGAWSSNPLISSKGAGLHVTSNAEFEGDVTIKGVSILETLEKIEKRLSILRPDPEKLAHFESLKKAYEHYKTLEALCELPTKEEE